MMNLFWFILNCALLSVSNGCGSVPGFAGTIYCRDVAPTDDYEMAAYQYATTSNMDGSMRPNMILYATNEDDVIAAIKYAKRNNVAIAVRTGGHQYSGASSTSGDNIQLDVSQAFVEFEWNENTGLLRVGVSWALRDLDAKMHPLGLFVPHGQCSQVYIGGHAQTGGYGPMIRAFGLFGDHIESFEIITADERKMTVRRNAQSPEEKDLFYAVLGGSPGNFGVLTHLTLRPRTNTLHPDSRALKVAYLYNKTVLKSLMDVAVEMFNDDELPNDWDLSVIVASATGMTDLFTNVTVNVDHDMLVRLQLIDRQTERPVHLIFVFAQYSNVSGATFDPNSSSNWFKRLTDAASNAHALQILLAFDPSVHTSLTDLSAGWVVGTVREYVMPFVRGVYMSDSKTLVQDDFTNSVTTRIDSTISAPNNGLHLTSQLAAAGGKHSMFARRPPGETAYSWRNLNFMYTMATFYEPSTAAHNNAVAFQQDITSLVVGSQGRFSKDEHRLLWASFGDHNMHNVWPYYYENQTKYDRLVRIKRHVDPANIFTPNEFCVGVGENFKTPGKGKAKAPPKVDDADFAPKLGKQRDLQFEQLVHGKKKQGLRRASGVAAGAGVVVVVLGATHWRKRNRTARPSDANCASSPPAAVTATASV